MRAAAGRLQTRACIHQGSASPENTNYYFYALESDGTHHHFSEIYSEHQQFLESQKDGQA